MTSNSNFEARAAAQPTELHKAFAEWLYIQTGYKVDLKTVQLATTMRHDFQKSEENQKALAARKAAAAKAKKAAATKKAAKLKAKLAEVAAETKTEEVVDEGTAIYRAAFEKARALGEDHGEATRQGGEARAAWERAKAAKVETVEEALDGFEMPEPKVYHKLTIVYGSNEPQVHKAGCADLRKLTSRQGYSRETRMVCSETELTEIIYSDMIDSGESSLEDCYGGYDLKPCCPALNA